MGETGMQKLIGQELIQVEVTCHEEVKTSKFSQTDVLLLEDQRRKEYHDIDNQQILCYNRYVTKHDTFFLFNL
jgi:hypothetical protein